ncbi:MAG: ArnT family glycosyltransferase [Cyanophyceae cyanobacterium]
MSRPPLETPPTRRHQRLIVKAAFWLIAIALGFLQAWNSRYSLSTGDAVSYLDLGKAYLQGDWDAAVTSYFAPLYPIFLASFQALLSPSSFWEFFVVKLTNLFILALSLVCFDRFLHEFIIYYNSHRTTDKERWLIPSWLWIVAGYILFIWSATQWIGVDTDSPDLLMSATIYLAMAIVLRISRSEQWTSFILLGVVLGLGYLTKSFMFPMAFIFLGVSFFSTQKNFRSAAKIAVAFLAFVTISCPYIYAISSFEGEFTFGSSGQLNYAWNVSPGGIHNHYWQGEPAGSGIPKHPIRQVFDQPTVYEFGEPIGGTYPPWHNPAYWNAGLQTTFNLRKQIHVLWVHALEYYRIFFGVLLFGYLIFVAVTDSWNVAVKNLLRNWILLIPACAGLGSFMLVHVRARYSAALIVILFAAFFGSVYPPNVKAVKRFTVTAVLSMTLLIWPQFATAAKSAGEPLQWKIANGLNQLGIESGERVAILGGYKVGSNYYWAKLADLKIVAEIPSIEEFWEADDATRQRVYDTLTRTGAKILVQEPGQDSPLKYLETDDWQKIDNTKSYVRFLR